MVELYNIVLLFSEDKEVLSPLFSDYSAVEGWFSVFMGLSVKVKVNSL